MSDAGQRSLECDIIVAMKITFWGAAGEVTGSMHQLTVDSRDYLLDCGMYQGRRKEA